MRKTINRPTQFFKDADIIKKLLFFPQNKCEIRNYDTFIIENHLFDIYLEKMIFYEFVEL